VRLALALLRRLAQHRLHELVVAGQRDRLVEQRGDAGDGLQPLDDLLGVVGVHHEQRLGVLAAALAAARLKELEQLGLIDRIVEPTTPVSVRYRLTVRGQDLLTSLQPLVAYGQRWERAPGDSQPEVNQPGR
jgi:hypothetical protein